MSEQPGIATSGTEPVTTGSNPEMFQVILNLPGYSAQYAFTEWVDSGDCLKQFRTWMSFHGHHF